MAKTCSFSGGWSISFPGGWYGANDSPFEIGVVSHVIVPQIIMTQ